MVSILLYTGLRRGELCGLEWKDIDWKKGLPAALLN
ncbi:tyrosine-type recombinase/integrase [Agathobaculum sp.]